MINEGNTSENEHFGKSGFGSWWVCLNVVGAITSTEWGGESEIILGMCVSFVPLSPMGHKHNSTV